MRERCIVCGAKLIKPPVYICQNIPASAQKLLTKEELDRETLITLNLCQCSGCGLVQFNNEPVDYYRDSTRAGERSDALIRLRRKQYRHLVETYHLQGKKILEIGAGKGGFLKTLKEMSEYNVQEYGIENNAEFVKTAREMYGVNVVQGFIDNEDMYIEDAPFDAFMSFAYPARLIDPNTMLRCVYNNLTSDGIGLVMVPSLEHLCKPGGYFDIVSDHIAYYSYNTLRFLMEHNGFLVLEEGEVAGIYLYVYVKKRPVFSAEQEFRDTRLATQELQFFLRSNIHEGRKIAVWCAGHYAFTVLACAGVTDEISYIVDNAKFKQGYYSPVTHIPIVGKEHIKNEPVDIVMILGSMYVDEIVEEIREISGNNIAIVTMGGGINPKNTIIDYFGYLIKYIYLLYRKKFH